MALKPLPELTVGQRRRIKMTMKYQGTLTDGTPTLRIKLPDLSTTVVNVGDMVHVGLGVYTYEYTFAQVGDYYIRAESSGAVVDVEEGRVKVLPSHVI